MGKAEEVRIYFASGIPLINTILHSQPKQNHLFLCWKKMRGSGGLRLMVKLFLANKTAGAVYKAVFHKSA